MSDFLDQAWKDLQIEAGKISGQLADEAAKALNIKVTEPDPGTPNDNFLQSFFKSFMNTDTGKDTQSVAGKALVSQQLSNIFTSPITWFVGGGLILFLLMKGK